VTARCLSQLNLTGWKPLVGLTLLLPPPLPLQPPLLPPAARPGPLEQQSWPQLLLLALLLLRNLLLCLLQQQSPQCWRRCLQQP
jgi:hypothetical protein